MDSECTQYDDTIYRQRQEREKWALEVADKTIPLEKKETSKSGTDPNGCLDRFLRYMIFFLVLTAIFLPIGLVGKANYNKATERRDEILANQRAICQLQRIEEVKCGAEKKQLKYTMYSDKCAKAKPLFMWSLCSFEPQEPFTALNEPFACYHADCSSDRIQLTPLDEPEMSQEKWRRACLKAGVVFASLTVCFCLCAMCFLFRT